VNILQDCEVASHCS